MFHFSTWLKFFNWKLSITKKNRKGPLLISTMVFLDNAWLVKDNNSCKEESSNWSVPQILWKSYENLTWILSTANYKSSRTFYMPPLLTTCQKKACFI